MENNFHYQEEEEEEEENGVERIVNETEEEEEEEEDEHVDDYWRIDTRENSKPKAKKQRLDKFALGFEFAPRIKAPPPQSVTAIAKPLIFGGRNSLSDWSWSEQETFVLLDAWGERFLQRGRKSLRSDQWSEVAKKVLQSSKTFRTDTQCRNRLDTLKKKYKKEKAKMSETGSSSKWVCFRKMDMLMTSSSPPQKPGLSCGLDLGECVFMNPRVYVNRSNGLDEMRDSMGDSETSEDDENGLDGVLPKRQRFDDGGGASSFRLLADSIQKFGEIYEKIENNKREQMLELEKMRMEFHRDLELQKRQILERVQVEIAKIRQGNDEEIDVSVEKTSG